MSRSYLASVDLFPEEILERLKGDRELFRELDKLIERQDKMIGRLHVSWVDDWYDTGSGGFLTVEDFIESEHSLLDFIPDSLRYNQLREIVSHAVEILGESNG